MCDPRSFLPPCLPLSECFGSSVLHYSISSDTVDLDVMPAHDDDRLQEFATDFLENTIDIVEMAASIG